MHQRTTLRSSEHLTHTELFLYPDFQFISFEKLNNLTKVFSKVIDKAGHRQQATELLAFLGMLALQLG